MAQQKSKKGKGLYAVYKTENRVQINKIRKLERHCKAYPEDKACANRLAELKKRGGYVPRSKPLIPGSNQTTPKVKPNPLAGFLHYPKTAGEQLSELLGIPLPRVKTRGRKPSITHKKRKNVKA
jgi:hypothetical protein